KVIKIKPDHFKAHYFLGMILFQSKDFDAAIKEFDIASRDSDTRPRALLSKGQALFDKGDFHNSVVSLERGLKSTTKDSDPVTLNLRFFLGIALESIREIPAAISQWEKIAEIKPGFRDVKDKLLSYQELRTDDRLKDLMIASNTEFERICKSMVQGMGFQILSSELEDENNIMINASEAEGKWRNTRRSNRLFKIVRTTKPLTEIDIRQLHDKMKHSNATRGVLITTGTVAKTAFDYAITRPVEIKDKTDLITLLKNASDTVVPQEDLPQPGE
ncbi:MAG: tetratricopeptide repeat protein, partial [Actinomycetia bacterium]|nr:tetratricopeptide repeat protein [Actinomycetes bacterium]